MGLGYTDYFRRLFERVNLGVRVEFRDVSFQGWRPDLNKCHENVDYWVKQHPDNRALRGWIFWPPDEMGRCRFMAHSVVEENGTLVDITPIDRNTQRQGLRFLSHLGSEKEFELLKVSHSEVLYPPITIDEWRQGQVPTEEM